MAPLGNQNFIQAPSQFSLLSEHHPSNCKLQFLKSLEQHPTPLDTDGDEEVGPATGEVTGLCTGAEDGGGEIGCPLSGTIVISAQFQNCYVTQ